MVQIIQGKNSRKTTADRFGEAFSNLGMGIGAAVPEYLGKREEENRKDIEASQIGSMLEGNPDVSGFSQELRRTALQHGLQAQEKAAKLRGDTEVEERNYNTFKDRIGPKFAEMWRSSPVGARTALESAAINSLARGENIEDLLDRRNGEQDQGNLENNQQISADESSRSKDYTQKPKGYSPKEWSDERRTWRKDNTPIFNENRVKQKANKDDILATKKLSQLNDHISEGLSRILIDPATGDFRPYAELATLKSPQAQVWSKVIARFQNRAKDAYGSRVTNFDLQSYMKQFPNLLNTKEGRSRIIEMMNINYELDGLYLNALQQVFDKYGLSGIPPEEADKLAREKIKDRTEELEMKYLSLDDENQMEEEMGMESGSGNEKVEVIGPDGQLYEMDPKHASQLPEGFRIK